MLVSADEEMAVGHSDAGDHFLAHRIGGEEFEGWAGGEDEGVTALVDGEALAFADHDG